MKCPVSICYNMSNLKIYKKWFLTDFLLKFVHFLFSVSLSKYLLTFSSLTSNSNSCWENQQCKTLNETVFSGGHCSFQAWRRRVTSRALPGVCFRLCFLFLSSHSQSFALSVCPEFNSYIPREGIWQNCGTCHENVTISVNKNKSVVSVTHHHS